MGALPAHKDNRLQSIGSSPAVSHSHALEETSKGEVGGGGRGLLPYSLGRRHNHLSWAENGVKNEKETLLHHKIVTIIYYMFILCQIHFTTNFAFITASASK